MAPLKHVRIDEPRISEAGMVPDVSHGTASRKPVSLLLDGCEATWQAFDKLSSFNHLRASIEPGLRFLFCFAAAADMEVQTIWQSLRQCKRSELNLAPKAQLAQGAVHHMRYVSRKEDPPAIMRPRKPAFRFVEHGFVIMYTYEWGKSCRCSTLGAHSEGRM